MTSREGGGGTGCHSCLKNVVCAHVSLAFSCSYNPGGKPGSMKVRSATSTGERQIRTVPYTVRPRNVRPLLDVSSARRAASVQC